MKHYCYVTLFHFDLLLYNGRFHKSSLLYNRGTFPLYNNCPHQHNFKSIEKQDFGIWILRHIFHFKEHFYISNSHYLWRIHNTRQILTGVFLYQKFKRKEFFNYLANSQSEPKPQYLAQSKKCCATMAQKRCHVLL